MKRTPINLGVMSDLHWEKEAFSPPTVQDVDVWVTAGDMLSSFNGHTAIGQLAQIGQYDKPVLYVPGNHEFDGVTLSDGLSRLRRAAKSTNVHILYNERLDHGGVRFLGATLWTNFDLYGLDNQQACEERAQKMGDFQIKRPDGSCLSIEEVKIEHQMALDFLVAELKQPFDGPTVVITHFAPHPGSLASQFGKDLANAWFVNNLDEDLICLADLWIHGHTHTSFDYILGEEKGRVLCNPGGFTNKITLKGQTSEMRQILLTQYPELSVVSELITKENKRFLNPKIIAV